MPTIPHRKQWNAGKRAGIPVLQINHPGIISRTFPLNPFLWIPALVSIFLEGPWTERIHVSFFHGDVGPLFRPSLFEHSLRDEGYILVNLKPAYSLLKWASYLSPAYLRVRGTEADRVYYALKKKEPVPSKPVVDYQLVLKKKQWKQLMLRIFTFSPIWWKNSIPKHSQWDPHLHSGPLSGNPLHGKGAVCPTIEKVGEGEGTLAYRNRKRPLWGRGRHLGHHGSAFLVVKS